MKLSNHLSPPGKFRQDGKYRVRLYGEWIVVPDNAVSLCMRGLISS